METDPTRTTSAKPPMVKLAIVELQRGLARDVLAAFHKARGARLPTTECYQAGVAAWLRHHPNQVRPYAAERAVAIILAHRWFDLLGQYRNEWDRRTTSKDEQKSGQDARSSSEKALRKISRFTEISPVGPDYRGARFHREVDMS